jgi:hypothetical protein
MDLKETGYEGVDWIHVVQDSGHGWDFAKNIINLQGMHLVVYINIFNIYHNSYNLILFDFTYCIA